jgi:hypothetical protein
MDKITMSLLWASCPDKNMGFSPPDFAGNVSFIGPIN